MTEAPGPGQQDIFGKKNEQTGRPRAARPEAYARARARIRSLEPSRNESITKDNPFGVRIPKQYAEYPPLIAVGAGLIKDFSTLYAAQLERIGRQETTVTLRPQAAFNQELKRFHTITSKVADIAHAQQGSDARIRVFSDLDESAGSVVGNDEPIRLPGYPNLRYEDMDPEQQAQHRALCAKSIFTDFAFSPGYVHALNYLHDTFDSDPGIDFGVISTKPQGGMSEYLMPTLDEVIPYAFRPNLILSSAPKEAGAVEFYTPEIAELAQDRLHPPTLGQAFAAFIQQSPPQEQEALRKMLAAYSRQALSKPITDFDIKLFIIVRMQQNEKYQRDRMLRQELSRISIGDMPPPETIDVLLDDARIPANLFPSVYVVKLDRWRLIDEKSKRRKRKVQQDDSGSESEEDILAKFGDL